MQNGSTTGRATNRLGRELVQPATALEAQVERLMSRLRLAVIFGGNKSTPGSVIYPSRGTRSWKSYEAVANDIVEALTRIGFQHVHLMPDDMHLGDRLRREGIHMAWLNTGGVQGYNPTAHAPAMLEMLGMPYVGHDPLSAATLDNKHAFKREALCAGLPTAPFVTWHMARGPLRPSLNGRFMRAFGDYRGPFVVKPVSGRASLHVHVVDSPAGLPDAVAEVYRATENVVLIEKYLPGREFCIAVAGPVTSHQRRLVRGRAPFAFAALERVLSAEERIFTSMDVRPITTERCHGLDMRTDVGVLEQLHHIAREVFLEFNLGSLIRIDLRSDESGRLFILEANPKPDLKAPAAGVTSLIAAGLHDADMDYDDLILSLLADRLDSLLTYRRDSVRHIVELMDRSGQAVNFRAASQVSAKPETAAEAYRHVDLATAADEHRAAVNMLMADAAVDPTDPHAVDRITEAAAQVNVEALDAALRPAARKRLRFGS
jgi:D-alanine-D-alanine ligase